MEEKTPQVISLVCCLKPLFKFNTMVALVAMPNNPYHVRSTSLPSRSHPAALKVEEQLHQLRAWEIPSSSTHLKTEMLREGLNGLRVLYRCVEDLLQSPKTQNAIAHNRHEKWVDEVLDGSLGMLDVCSTTRDAFMEMKEIVKDLQSALRRQRKGAEEDFSYKVGTCTSSKKQMKKKIEKCIRSMKKMERKYDLSPLLDNDQFLATVIRVLREVRSITISIFESLLSFMSSSRPSTKSSLVSKWMRTGRRVACEGEVEKMNEMERMDATLYAHGNKSSRDVDPELMQSSQKHLEAAIESIQGLEDGLDSMYRGLIKTRVSLLNILNH